MRKILNLSLTLILAFILIACTPSLVEDKEYTVTFELHNGQDPITAKYLENQLVEEPVEPTYDGYEFDNWYKDAELTQIWVFAADRVTSDVTIHAGWTESELEEAYNIDMWIESSYVNVLREMEKQDDSDVVAKLDVAKNEYESFQVLLRSTLTFEVEAVEFSDLSDKSGNAILKNNLSFNFVEHQYFEQNSPGVGRNDVIQSGAGYYPDALSNETTFNVIARRTLPIWVTLFIPKDTVAGNYTGRITVHTNHGVVYIPMDIEVYNVTIPDGHSDDATYNNVFWQLIIGSGFGTAWADNHPNDILIQLYGHKRWTEGWWDIVAEIGQVMKENRVNTLYVQTVSLLVDGGSKLNEDGTYTFNWSKFDEYIEYFVDNEIVNSFFGYMMMTGGNVNAITNDQNGKPVSSTIKFDSDEAKNWFEAYLPALEEHLREKGWLDKWSQALRDEPVMSGDQFRHYQELTAMVNRLAPDLRYGDPTQFNENSKHLVDINAKVLIPLIEVHNNRLEWYQDLDEDQTVLTYTAVIPQGSWLNRFIDKPVYHGRHIGWYNFGHGASGYLHWGLMAWYRPITDFALGDTASIYPDVEKGTIKSTIRLANLRDGAEDYELLSILAKTNPELAHILANEMASDAHTGYTKDIDHMIYIRSVLVKAAAGEPVDVNVIESLEINEGDLSLKLGEDRQLTTTLIPSNTTHGMDLLWQSSDLSIVHVNTRGFISTVSEGTATITVSSREFPNVKDTIEVVVTAKQAANHLVLNSTDDSYINGNNHASNHGSEIALYVSSLNNSASGAEQVRHSLIKFDTSSITRTVESATLRLYFNTIGYPGNQKVGVYLNQSHDWKESSVTWTNAPKLGEKLGEIDLTNPSPGTYYGVGAGYNLEVDPNLFVAGEAFSITLVLEDGDYVTLYSKENNGKHAQLFLELSEGDPIVSIEIDDHVLGLPGSKYQLNPVINPAQNYESIFYTSSDESVVTVDEFGLVTAIGEGTAEITLTNASNSVTAISTITVLGYIDVTSILLDEETLTLDFLEEKQLSATTQPSDANHGTELSWVSSDPDIVFVDQTGRLIAKNVGEATITVSSILLPDVKKQIVVHVNDIPNQSVYNVQEDAIIYNADHQKNNGNSDTLFTTYDHPRHRIVLKFELPELDFTVANGFLRVYLKDVEYIGSNLQIQAYYPTVETTWSQDNVTWATAPATSTSLIRHVAVSSELNINSWIDIPLQVKYERLYQSGQLTLTILTNSSNKLEIASLETGLGAMLILNHERPITDIDYLESEVEIEQIGETIQPVLNIFPSINHEPIFYTSSNEEVATVDVHGAITAVAPGSAVITAGNESGSVSTFINVTVHDIKQITSIDFNLESLSLEIGENILLETIFNEGANDGLELEWTSSNQGAIMINDEGRVFAQNEGTSTITVSSIKYPNVSNTLDIEVLGFEDKVVFNVIEDAVIFNNEQNRNDNGNTIVSPYTQPRSRGVLKFNVQALNFEPTKAYIRVFLVRNESTAENTWIQFYSPETETQWSEETITWATTFPTSLTIVSYRAPVTMTPNTWVDIPINAAGLERLKTTGQLSLTFLANGTGLFEFMSKETGQGAMIIIE